MNTKLIMWASALILGLFGLILSFLPQEISSTLAMQTDAIVLQLLGAVYFGFAFLNWMNKNKVLGGIYGRPIVMANFIHFLMGALALIKFITKGSDSTTLLIITVVYVLFGLVFAFMAFTHPNLKGAED